MRQFLWRVLELSVRAIQLCQLVTKLAELLIAATLVVAAYSLRPTRPSAELGEA